MNDVRSRRPQRFRRRLPGAEGPALLSRSHCHREPIAFTAGQAIDEICIRFDYIFFVGTFFVLFYNVLRISLHLIDGKTGARTVHLSPSAVRVLTDLPRKPGNPWVIPGAKPGTHMTDIDGAWETIRARGGTARRAHPRHPAFLRLAGACARRGAADHRPAARSQPSRDDRALCAPCARLDQGIRRPNRRQHRRRYPVGASIPVTRATFMLLLSESAIRSHKHPLNPAHFLDSSLHPQKGCGCPSPCRNRLNSNSRSRLAFHGFFVGFRGFAGGRPIAAPGRPK